MIFITFLGVTGLLRMLNLHLEYLTTPRNIRVRSYNTAEKDVYYRMSIISQALETNLKGSLLRADRSSRSQGNSGQANRP